MKEANDQCDESLKAHLFNYSRTVEEMLMMEATTISPVDKENPGIKFLNNVRLEHPGVNQIVQAMDNEADFQEFMINYMSNLSLNLAESPMQLPLPDGTIQCNFAVNLVELMERYDDPVPKMLKKCIEYVEEAGLKVPGLYREPGKWKNSQRIRDAFNKGIFNG